MKKETAIIGSARKGATYQAVWEFAQNIELHDAIDFEYVFLSDYNLEFCRGCKLCFDRGEEHCPLKDDRDRLLEDGEFRWPGLGFAELCFSGVSSYEEPHGSLGLCFPSSAVFRQDLHSHRHPRLFGWREDCEVPAGLSN